MTIRRVMVSGTVGAGKSTFVQTVGEMGTVSIDRVATDQTASLKPTTTVALDFCGVTLNPNLALHVYGTPGQFRFNFMWEILLQKTQICLLLVAAHRRNDLLRTRQILNFIQQRSSIPILLGLTHTDCPGTLTLEEILTSVGYRYSNSCPLIFTVNPRDKNSVFNVLNTAADILISLAKAEC